MRPRVIVVGTAVILPLLLAACSSTGGTAQAPTPTPTAAPTARAVVNVTASSRICSADRTAVPFGQVQIVATGVGRKDVSVTVFGPKDGRWTKAIGVIPLLVPGSTKAMTVTLPLGAYEIACQTNRDDNRNRLTAV